MYQKSISTAIMNMQSIVLALNLVFLGSGANTFTRHPHIL